MIFKGSCVALVTPFDQNGINRPAFEKLVEFQLTEGTDALLVCGTTGEPSTMTAGEKKDAIECVVNKAAGRVPVIAGIGGNNTEKCIKTAQLAAALGADAVLAVTPYYNKCSEAGLIAHFTAIADASEKPVILYNVPSRTCVNITPAAAEKLSGHQNIAGIKEACGNISQIAEMARRTNGNLDIYSGNDDQIQPILSLGGLGVISVLANIMPRYTHELAAAYFEGDTAKACEMQLKVLPLVSALFCEVNPIPVKTALNLMGFEMGPLRLPLCEMTPAHLENLKAQLSLFELI
jgi:4-hydroxy-tetrahydrodipicolinate synthase